MTFVWALGALVALNAIQNELSNYADTFAYIKEKRGEHTAEEMQSHLGIAAEIIRQAAIEEVDA